VGTRVCKFALFSAALIALGACKPKAQASPASTASASAVPRLAPLTAASWLVDLDVPGFGRASVAVPIGATQPRAILIALHGPADRPEWICGAFRGIAGPSPFVLCPRGIRRADSAANDVRYTFGTADDTSRELRAALTELKRKFGNYVAPGPVIFGGLELGADHAAWIAREAPAFFSRLLLIDPSEATWPSSQAAIFGRQSGARVLFAGDASRQGSLELKAVLTRRSGADARAVALIGPGSGVGPAVVHVLSQSWPWLASAPNLHVPQNLAGNALPAGGPVAGRPAP
jgi:hypothetical protein